MDMKMQRTFICIMDKDMQHGHGQAAWAYSMDMQHGDMDMQHLQGYVA
jgi:hypothetical protein